MEQLDLRNTAKNFLEQGHKLRIEGKLDNAIAIYQQVINLDSNASEAYHFMGECLTQKNDLESAAKSFEQAIQVNPNYCWSYHCLSQVLFWQQKVEKAIFFCRQSIDLKPNYANFHGQLGQYLARQGEVEQAISSYQNAIDLNPSLPASVYSALTALMLQQDNLDEVLDYCRKAVKHNPESAELHFNHGKILAAKQLWQEAAISYTKAINIKPSYWDAHQNLGDVLLHQNQLNEAKGAHQRAEIEFYQAQEFSKSDLPEDFDWQVYLALNPDLNITSKFQAISHLMLYGLKEKKLYALKHLHDPQKRPDIAPQSVIDPTDRKTSVDSVQPLKLAVLVHIYYFELWPELRDYLKNIDAEFDLLINIVASIWEPHMHDQIREYFPQAKILISENRGRDIGGHLSLMAHLNFTKYNLFCLLHTKKSPHINSMISDMWRRDLLDAILGSKEKVKANLEIMGNYPNIGLIGSRYWRSTAIANNVENYNRLLADFAIKEIARKCEYLSGTMMFIRPVIMQVVYNKFKNVELELGDEKELSFHSDGQIAHSIERLIGNLVKDQQLDFFWQ